MTEASPKVTAETPRDSAPANHHRRNSTPTKGTSSRQRSQPKAQSPDTLHKKRKRDLPEVLQDVAIPSDTTSQQPTLSSTADASADQPALPVVSIQQTSSSSMGRSVSMTSITPGEGQMQANLTSEDGKDPHLDPAAAAADDNDCAVVWRSKEKLAACLGCDLCHEVLKDPVTAPECMHSFCRNCIDQHVVYGGTKNICPVCKATDLQTVFGPQPFQHGKLQFDPMLADMIRKLFPRADVEQGIQERQDAEARFRASLVPVKKAKTGHAKTTLQSSSALASAPLGNGLPVSVSSHLPASVNPPRTQTESAANARVGVFLQTLGSKVQLALPYLWVQQGMPLKSLCAYVSSQLRLDNSLYQVSLDCEGTAMQSAVTVGHVWQQWLQTHPLQDLVVIQVRIQQTSSSHPAK